jgi:hypothetical protein
MELDCTILNDVTLDSVAIDGTYPIIIATKSGYITSLTKYGQQVDIEDAKCAIFPKGKTTWEGFVPPCKFKDGDIVATNSGQWIGITTGGVKHEYIPTYCVMKSNGKFEAYIDRKKNCSFGRLATEEEKQKLFDAIKENGYRWDAEAKTLEKKEKKDKFVISALKIFESRVLVRDTEYEKWLPGIWGLYNNGVSFYPYIISGGHAYAMCIPYEGNEHLCGTKDDCDEFYKTWK